MIGKKFLVFFIFIMLIFLSGCTETQDDMKSSDNSVSGPVELDVVKENTHLSWISNVDNAYWMRSGWFPWNDVEPEEGDFDWDYADDFITGHQNKEADCLLVVIFPYANWDQDACHSEEYEADFGKEKGGALKVGVPCDMDAYKNYLKKLVERYDGDGIDDMPGLKIPVKYWEICNEPSMQGGSTGGAGEELKFFVGTSEEYVELLKASYEAIKEADPEAKVLHAGIAGMNQEFQDFWDPIYASDIGDYFDIANVHTISTDEKREDLYVAKYTSFLSKYGLEDKPIWITEVQFGDLMEEPEDIESFNSLIVRSTVFSLALGADKLFYIENWAYWKTDSKTTQTACKNLISFMNDFDSIEVLKQEYIENQEDFDGLTSLVGQYKITKDNEVFYVLWGNAELPDEITGTIKVTDIYGVSKTTDAADLTLTDEPYYVELI